MNNIPAQEAYANLKDNIRKKIVSFPNKNNSEFFISDLIFPKLSPKFSIKEGSSAFTIGSCFARNIEIELIKCGLDVPVAQFTAPDDEIRFPIPHLLNEYNAGTILQRIESAVGEFSYSDDMGIEETKDGILDMFLHKAAKAGYKFFI